jgi:hypothetical protein
VRSNPTKQVVLQQRQLPCKLNRREISVRQWDRGTSAWVTTPRVGYQGTGRRFRKDEGPSSISLPLGPLHQCSLQPVNSHTTKLTTQRTTDEGERCVGQLRLFLKVPLTPRHPHLQRVQHAQAYPLVVRVTTTTTESTLELRQELKRRKKRTKRQQEVVTVVGVRHNDESINQRGHRRAWRRRATAAGRAR